MEMSPVYDVEPEALKRVEKGLACGVMCISQTCYRYVSRAHAENEKIANWLPRSGCGTTITNAQTWHWSVSPQNSGWPWPH